MLRSCTTGRFCQPFTTSCPRLSLITRNKWKQVPCGRLHSKLVVSVMQRSDNEADVIESVKQPTSNSPPPETEASNEPNTSMSAIDAARISSSSVSSTSSSASLPSISPGSRFLNIAYRKTLKWLSDLPRAIYTMMSVAALSGLGTIIDQNKSYEFYIENYPEGPGAVLGFLSYKVLLTLELDHIYTAWYFLGLLVFLAASLAACTYTRQFPIAKVAQRWRFATRPEAMVSLGKAEVLPNGGIRDFGKILSEKGYQVFLKEGKQLYAFKGLAGRLGPIGVHAALLLIMAGTSLGTLSGFKGTVMCPEGQVFDIGEALVPVGPLSINPFGSQGGIRVNSFDIDYRPDGAVAQFYSDLSVVDRSGREIERKRISVNQPLRYGGVTMYQTDWSIAGANIKLLGAPQEIRVGLPMTNVEEGDAKLFVTYLPLEQPTEQNPTPRGISFLARDLQSVALYDSQGKFVGVRRPGSGKPITIDGVTVVVESLIGATGLELKSDPGVPVVYAGFAGLMITVIVSYFSHSQVWALQQDNNLYVAGRTNRGVVLWENEFNQILDRVPELPPTANTS